MNVSENLRAQTLSAPNYMMMIGDPVFARRGPLDHEFRARVVGRTIGRAIYDVETADGELVQGVSLVRLDEEALAVQQTALSLEGVS
ncbi:hypothetical protein [Profundibacter sp.]